MLTYTHGLNAGWLPAGALQTAMKAVVASTPAAASAATPGAMAPTSSPTAVASDPTSVPYVPAWHEAPAVRIGLAVTGAVLLGGIAYAALGR